MADFSLLEDYVMLPFSREVMKHCSRFSCGDEDLNNFFLEDSFLYADEMLGKTYCWITNSPPYKIVAMVTLANDSIKVHKMSATIRNKVQRKISNSKRGRSYPAVLIGRIGVNEEFRRLHLGSQILAFIKGWFCHEDNKTGCRFIVVDAYNKPQILQYYTSNGFKFLFKSESDEKAYYEIDDDKGIHTRLMYFDLKNA